MGTLRIIRRITADGMLEMAEVLDLANFLNDCREARHQWPGNIIWETLQSIFEDNEVSAEEMDALGNLLASIEAECATSADLGLTSYIRSASRAELEAARLPRPVPFQIPLVAGEVRLESSGDKAHHVSLDGPSCDCGEWIQKRSTFPAGHPARICRCIAQVYAELIREGWGADWPVPFKGMVEDLAELYRGSDLAANWLSVAIHGRSYLLAVGEGEWVHIHGPSSDKEYDRFSYRRKDRSWFFGVQAPEGDLIALCIDRLDSS